MFFVSLGARAGEPDLNAKIGQMLLVGFRGEEVVPRDAIVQDILQQRIGGVILFDDDQLTGFSHRNITSPQQVRRLIDHLQMYAKQAARERGNTLDHLLIAIDYEGGQVARLTPERGFVNTQTARYLGQQASELTDKQASEMADTLQQIGVNLNFAPTIDVNLNPEHSIINEKQRSFSEDVTIVIDRAHRFTKAYRHRGIQCVYKHFPGHGSAALDTHAGFVDVTELWRTQELLPYQHLLKEPDACGGVLVAHVVNKKWDKTGLPASLSKAVITGMLRDQFEFQGVVFSDDLQMKAITDHYGLAEAVKLALLAGTDVLVFGNQLAYQEDIANQVFVIIKDLLAQGVIDEARIDDSFQRIQRFKKGMPIQKSSLDGA